ncbi:SDR family NAD(P)-dependent oxidoreductase [uncultured Ilumatobacter sp.]|uniref:SDR family NAD(P)-dependent oxidoreductase n=1 Tax=uncultured Ilumatobacter sp. TaxID=879968 RepID=UPI00374E36CE
MAVPEQVEPVPGHLEPDETAPAQDFAADVAVITGAGSGIGRATAEYIARRGAAIVVNDLDGDAAELTVNALASLGARAVAVVGSVADSAVADELIETAVAEFGHVDIVVNNAGGGQGGRLVDLTDEQIRADIESHLLGTIWVTRAALRVMGPADTGRIVNTASSAGAFGIPEVGGYAAAKAGIIGFTKATALEVAKSGVAINAIAPIASTRLAAGFFKRYSSLDQSRYRVESIPPVTAFLASRACPLNGELISIAAGRAARIFTGTASGHLDPHADHHDIAAHLDAIMSTEHPVIPRSAFDEFLLIEV